MYKITLNMLRIYILLCIFVISVIFFPSLKAQEINLEAKKIEYTLPYAGILPDHPLFFLKRMRDRILEFATRDYLKKAKLYLLFSDKHTRMAIELSEKGKWTLSSETMQEAEKYFSKIVPLLSISKKQGVSPEGALLENIKLSNEKHREVAESLLADAPQGDRKILEKVLEQNRKNKELLAAF